MNFPYRCGFGSFHGKAVRASTVLSVLAVLFSGWSSGAVAADPPETITHVRALHLLGDEALKSSPPVRLRGVVVHRYPTRSSFILQDEFDGAFVDLSRSAGRLPAGIVPGALVEVEGTGVAGRFAPMVSLRGSEQIHILGTAPLPEPLPLTSEAARAGLFDGARVVAEGVVRRAPATPVSYATPALEMVFESTRLFVYLNATEEGWDDLVDARIRVTGISSGIWNRQGQISAPCLMAIDRRDLVVLKKAPADPYASPVIQAGDMLRYRPQDEPGHRIRVNGVVLNALSDGRVFVFSGDRTVCVECVAAPNVIVGDAVDAVGFPSMRERSPLLEDAIVRASGHQTPMPDAIKRQESEIIAQCKDYEFVQVDATLLETQRAEIGIDLLLQSGDRLFKATVDGPGSAELLPRLQPGATLSLSGLVLFSFPLRGTQASVPSGFSLLVRSPGDVRIVQRPPWWTARRLLGMLGAAVALTLVLALWNHILRGRAKVQQEIISGQARREGTSEERARLARELHDTLEQEFVGIARQTEALEHAGPLTSPAREALDILRQMLKLSRDNARRAVWDLRDPALLDCGLEAAIRNAVQRIVAGKPVVVNFRTEMSTPANLTPNMQVNIVRLAQEAVTNAIKHSNATSIDVSLSSRDGMMELGVTDDGSNGELGSAAAPGHFGIIGMRERCEKLGGRFEIHSKPGGGTSVHATIPVSGDTI